MSDSTPGIRRQRMAQRNTLDLRHAQPLPPRVRRPDVRPPDKPEVIPPAPGPEAVAPVKTVAKPKTKPHGVISLLQYPAIAIGAVAAAYSTSLGQYLVLGFVIIAVITRRQSRLSFGAALFLLITIPLFQALGQTGIAQNVAVYTFELLAFGVFQAIWESRKLSSN